MATSILVPVAEYLSTSYEQGDREYLDGRIVERNVGETRHSRIQLLLGSYLTAHYGQYWAGTECRVKISESRYRIPDVCLVTREWPAEPGPLEIPPFLAVEILSPDDRAGDLEEKIADYLSRGVKYVWVINPQTKRAFVHTSGGFGEASDGVLRTLNPQIDVPLSELFR